ncbi:MAG: hypothetical protein ACRDPQ_12855 [Nocardioidaceae bacterium]
MERVRVLPCHLDVVGEGREQFEAASDGGDGVVELPADETDGGQLVERVALQPGVADPMGQLDGAFGQVGVRRVELVLPSRDGEHGRLDADVAGRQGQRLPQQGPLLAGRRKLGHDARCVRHQLGRARQLEGGAAWVIGPAGRLGRGMVEPHRLVARVPPPGHGSAEMEGVGGFGRVGGQGGGLLVPLLGFAGHPPRVGEPGGYPTAVIGVT